MQISTLGIDLGKNSCSVVGLDMSGRVVMRRQMQRTTIIKFVSGLSPCVVAIEACCGAHHLGRALKAQGHEVRLMSPEYPKGRAKFERRLDTLLGLPGWLEVTARIRSLLTDLMAEWQDLDRRIKAFDQEFMTMARTDENMRRVATIPGIGVLNATALVAAIGNGETFAWGRDLAAWLGLVPRQATTGGKPRLLGISKRGSKYLRKLLIHGARGAMPSLAKSATALGAWLRSLLARAHPNTVVVALANKLARIVWAVLHNGRTFEAVAVSAA